MSYDLFIQQDVCRECGRETGESVDIKHDSPTYNYGRMIREADRLAGGDGCSFEAIDGKPGREAIKWFSKIREMLIGHEATMRSLEPENGWGTYGGLLDCFNEYCEIAKSCPDGVWRQYGAGATDGDRCCAGWPVKASD